MRSPPTSRARQFRETIFQRLATDKNSPVISILHIANVSERYGPCETRRTNQQSSEFEKLPTGIDLHTVKTLT
jgi:hypothetical protein